MIDGVCQGSLIPQTCTYRQSDDAAPVIIVHQGRIPSDIRVIIERFLNLFLTRHYCRILMGRPRLNGGRRYASMMTSATFHFLLNHGSFSLGRHISYKRNHNNNFRLSTNSCQPPLLMARTYATSKQTVAVSQTINKSTPAWARTCALVVAKGLTYLTHVLLHCRATEPSFGAYMIGGVCEGR